MTFDELVLDTRNQKSSCCQSRVQVMYRSITSARETAAYICLNCDRLYTVDSRDQEKKSKADLMWDLMEAVKAAREAGFSEKTIIGVVHATIQETPVSVEVKKS